jgi:hypothetical protein
MFETDIKILHFSDKIFLYNTVLSKHFGTRQFINFFIVSLFFENILNKNFDLFLLSKIIFLNNKRISESSHFVEIPIRRIFLILNSLIQCDVISTSNLLNSIKYRGKLVSENLFFFLTKKINKNLILSFFHKILCGKTLLDILNLYQYFPKEFIKIKSILSFTIRLSKITTDVKEKIIIICLKKQNFYNNYLDKNHFLEIYLNNKTLKKFVLFDFDIFIPSNFLFLFGINNHNMHFFFNRFMFHFYFIIENLFFILENNFLKIHYFSFSHKHIEFYNRMKLENSIKFLIIMLQSLEVSCIYEHNILV